MKSYKDIVLGAWDKLEKIDLVSSLSPEFNIVDLKNKVGILDVRYSNAYSGSYQKMAIIGFDKKNDCYISIGEINLNGDLNVNITSNKKSFAFYSVDYGCENCKVATYNDIKCWLGI